MLNTTTHQSFLDTLTPDRRAACLSAFARGFHAGLVGDQRTEERHVLPNVDSLVTFFRYYPAPIDPASD